MGTFERWRRAYGALKDSTTVGLAKVNSEYKNLDISIVKATNHDECPPKDIHVRRIIVATSFAVPRADVGYCIHTLSRRLKKTKNWIVAAKTLMVFHRILREGDPSFREDLLIFSRTRHIFRILDFRDESSKLAWDCSSWIRSYATFLEERLECYRVLGFDIETERLTTSPGVGKAYSRTRFMNVDLLLDQLPAMQQLLYRLIACQPEGAAYNNHLIQHALALVLKESLKIYCVINDGIIKLVESFFNLSKGDAVNALNIYKRVGKQAEQLGEFYTRAKHLRLTMNIQFPTLSQPPPSFLATMEDYIKGACSINGSRSNKKLIKEHQDVVEERSPYKTKESMTREIEEAENKEVLQDQEQELKSAPKVEEQVEPLIAIDDNDSPGLNETNQKAVELEDSNASRPALAIVQPGTMSSGWNETEKMSSWELALVTSPNNTNNTNTISAPKPGGGIDNLALYSLYEDDLTKKQKRLLHMGYYNSPGYEKDFFHHHHRPPQQDPCIVASGGATPPANMQIVITQQQQQQQHIMYQQQYQNQYQQWQQQQPQNMLAPSNHQQSLNEYAQPFGDAINFPKGSHGYTQLV